VLELDSIGVLLSESVTSSSGVVKRAVANLPMLSTTRSRAVSPSVSVERDAARTCAPLLGESGSHGEADAASSSRHDGDLVSEI
jgi:hypothetical protein